MEILDFIVVVICGLGIGVLSGMFGIGGGGMIVPLLHMAFGLPIIAATSTSLLTIAPTGISGSIKHIRQKTVSLQTGLIVGGCGAVASVASSLVADKLPDAAVVILTAVVILFSVGMMVRTLIKSRHTGTAAEEAKGQHLEEDPEDAATDVAVAAGAVPRTHTPTPAQEKGRFATYVVPVIIGLIAGGIAGIVGVGGGFIIVPFCVAYLGFSLKKAAGTSLISIAIIAIPGIISHALLGHIEWLYGLAIMIGTIPGAQVGAWLISRLPERPMCFAFAGLLTIIGFMMLVQEFFF